jgi:membrane associated rhomboid family serine protease
MLSITTLFEPEPADEPDDPDEHGDRRDAFAPLHEMLRARQPRLIVTPAILAVIGAIFVVMVATSGEVAFSPLTVDRWGAQSRPAIAGGEWWRLLTAMWLHAHPLHLGVNALFLWRFGGYVERLLGPVVFLIVYLLAGVVASAVSLQFQASNGVNVGASGAIFGLVGVLLTVAMTSRGSGGLGGMVAELRPSLMLIIVANLILGFMMQGVDNAAHIGGLAGGLVLGWLVGRHSLDATPSPRLTLIPIVMTAAVAAASVLSVGGRQDVRGEVARVGMRIDRAEAAFRLARTDIEAGRRRSADVAAEAERTVLPFIHDAQGRADELLRAAMAQAHTWAVCLARYDDAWRRRVTGLRDGDAASVADGDARAAAAIRDISEMLARTSSENTR